MSRILTLFTLFFMYTSPLHCLVLKRGNSGEPTSLDPHHALDFHSCAIVRDLYEGLTTVGAKNAEPILAGAENVHISEDGKTYTFTLKDRKWSDGSRVTAHDYVYAWQRGALKETASPYAHLFNIIDKTHAPHAKTFVVELKTPAPYFLGLISHTVFVPLHKPSLEKHGKQFMKPGNMISSGAYVLKAWEPHEKIVAVKNPYYPSRNNIDEVHYMAVEDPLQEYKHFLAGDIDITAGVPENMPDVLMKKPELAAMYKTSPHYAVIYLTLNPYHPNLEKRDVRRAISVALNRERLTQKVTKMGEIPAHTYTPNSKAALEEANLSPEERHKLAQKLLKKAGYTQKNPLVITYQYNLTPAMKKIATALKHMLEKDLPLKVNIEGMEWKAFLNSRKDLKKAQISRAGLVSLYNDAHCFLNMQTSDSGMNDGIFKNKTFDDLMEKSNIDLENRKAILTEAEQRLLESYKIVPLYYAVSKHMVKPYVSGHYGNLLDIFYTKDISLEKDSI